METIEELELRVGELEEQIKKKRLIQRIKDLETQLVESTSEDEVSVDVDCPRSDNNKRLKVSAIGHAPPASTSAQSFEVGRSDIEEGNQIGKPSTTALTPGKNPSWRQQNPPTSSTFSPITSPTPLFSPSAAAQHHQRTNPITLSNCATGKTNYAAPVNNDDRFKMSFRSRISSNGEGGMDGTMASGTSLQRHKLNATESTGHMSPHRGNGRSLDYDDNLAKPPKANVHALPPKTTMTTMQTSASSSIAQQLLAGRKAAQEADRLADAPKSKSFSDKPVIGLKGDVKSTSKRGLSGVDEDTCFFSGLRFKDRLVSNTEMKSYLEGRSYFALKDIIRASQDESCGDWITIGVLVRKSSPKIAANNKKILHPQAGRPEGQYHQRVCVWPVI